jgi:hypothetical protein
MVNRRVPPHPSPLPPGEGESSSAMGNNGTVLSNRKLDQTLALPRGEGRGEGEGRSMISSACQGVDLHPAKLDGLSGHRAGKAGRAPPITAVL